MMRNIIRDPTEQSSSGSFLNLEGKRNSYTYIANKLWLA